MRNTRRRQQVKRQLIVGGGIILLLAAALIIGFAGRSGRSEARETAQTKPVEISKGAGENAGASAGESVKERLDRVYNAAVKAGYPAEIIELLDKNEETVDFVENYGKKKDIPPVSRIEELKAGEIPKLFQWDERWGYAPYGQSTVAASGCGPTCLSMVIAGLSGDASVTPAAVAEYGTLEGSVDEENRTYWDFIRNAGLHWGITSHEIGLDEEEVAAELDAGHPIICSMGPGDFTQNGHFIVLTDYLNGHVTVHDPFSQKNSSHTWEFAKIEDQIKAMWVYTK